MNGQAATKTVGQCGPLIIAHITSGSCNFPSDTTRHREGKTRPHILIPDDGEKNAVQSEIQMVAHATTPRQRYMGVHQCKVMAVVRCASYGSTLQFT
ncbi:hypothetical protein AVEN_60783-1 [Araneus ventricosus]|uniref:Uncharacterized protein n=1 Tax=Araneus ventricosus TaxID=182803 RepID=A0A4Y2VL96_ARAVE|nr:hypothetical protein AVEN_96327-1 [Araneus ventricosus]GBO24440.1 hypothetical protein AVEN_60783-1 [Araneus ventricosus]